MLYSDIRPLRNRLVRKEDLCSSMER